MQKKTQVIIEHADCKSHFNVCKEDDCFCKRVTGLTRRNDIVTF